MNIDVDKILIKLSRVTGANGGQNPLMPFGLLLYGFEILPVEPEYKDSVAYAKKDPRTGRLTIHINTESELIKDEKEFAFVLLHELFHILSYHHVRARLRDPKLWNIACDHVINLRLLDAPKYLVKKPKGAVIISELSDKNMTEEEVYKWLLKKRKEDPETLQQILQQFSEALRDLEQDQSQNQSQNQNQGQGQNQSQSQSQNQGKDQDQGQGQSQGQDQDQGQGQISSYNQSGITAEDTDKLITKLRGITELIKKQGNLKGNESNRLNEFLDSLIKVEIPWWKILERAINNIMKNKTQPTWARVNYATYHLYRSPGLYEDLSPDKMFIAIDQSGSMSDDDLKKAAYVIKSAADYFNEIQIVHHDYSISLNKTIEANDPELEDLIKLVTSRGGTSHEEVFDLLEEQFESGESPSIILMFTDYMSDCEQLYKSGKYKFIDEIPIIWLIPKNAYSEDPSFGVETIKV